MFKRLVLCLTLVMILTVGPVIAMEEDQECTMIKGSKVIQMMPDRSMRGVTVPDDITITIGPELDEASVENLNSQNDMDWDGAHMGMIQVDFGRGPEPLVIIVKTTDVKDCK